MPYTKLCRKWHVDRQKEKDREKELIGSVSVINRVCLITFYYCGNKIILNLFLDQIVVEALFNARDDHDELEYEDLLTIIEKTQVPGQSFLFVFKFEKATRNSEFYLFGDF